MENVGITAIYQVDRYHFALVWTDGRESRYRLSWLQRQCPCVRCTEAKEKKQRLVVDENVLAERIVSVGRYALHIAFTSGCSQGIYSFSLLRQWKVGGRT